MFNGRLHLGLRCISLLLLLDELLNLGGIQARRSGRVVLDVARLDQTFDPGFDVAVRQILVLQN